MQSQPDLVNQSRLPELARRRCFCSVHHSSEQSDRKLTKASSRPLFRKDQELVRAWRQQPVGPDRQRADRSSPYRMIKDALAFPYGPDLRVSEHQPDRHHRGAGAQGALRQYIELALHDPLPRRMKFKVIETELGELHFPSFISHFAKRCAEQVKKVVDADRIVERAAQAKLSPSSARYCRALAHKILIALAAAAAGARGCCCSRMTTLVRDVSRAETDFNNAELGAQTVEMRLLIEGRRHGLICCFRQGYFGGSTATPGKSRRLRACP